MASISTAKRGNGRSPLRYPGGKKQLSRFIDNMVLANTKNMEKGEPYYFCEPFCGGANVALDQLFKHSNSRILLNDYDPSIYSFWKGILLETDRFIKMMEDTPVNHSTRKEIKEEYEKLLEKTPLHLHGMDGIPNYDFLLGFYAFYLNRVNRSGIITGGPICKEGSDTEKKYPLDCRFNKEILSQKIREIAKEKHRIQVSCEDVVSFIDHILFKFHRDELFVFFDPPYYVQGNSLYKRGFSEDEHKRLSEKLLSLNHEEDFPWIVTYDNADEIKAMYSGCETKYFEIQYSVNKKRKEWELLLHKNGMVVETTDDIVLYDRDGNWIWGLS